MSAFRENPGFFATAVMPMKDLPANVGPNSPVTPANDVFTIIPAGGEMTPALWEEFLLPVTRQGLFKHYPDVRGHRVYIKLQFAHQALSAGLKADLAGRWAVFGVPWTGTLTTNTFAVDVPAAPLAAARCVEPQPAHPVSSRDQNAQTGK